MRPATAAVHAGTPPAAPGELCDLSPALHLSSVFHTPGVRGSVELEDMTGGVSSYTRTSNPTTLRLERALAELEGADEALATPSGMAALTLVLLTLLRPDDVVAYSPHCYADTVALLAELSGRTGVTLVEIELHDPSTWPELVRREVTWVVVETPSNPLLHTVDVAALALRMPPGARMVVDATLATPVNLRPLALGADLVVHSASKYLGGHANVVAGAVAGPAELIGPLRRFRTLAGLNQDPHTSWLVLQGLQTLHLRVQQQNRTGATVAAFLDDRPDVSWVAHPGYGGVVAFGLPGDQAHLTGFLESLRLCTLAVSLGGTRTVIEAPTLMSHVQGGPDSPTLAVLPPGTVRLSVGVEDPEDIVDDLRAGLDAVRSDRGGRAG